MSIRWRRPSWADIEEALTIQPRLRGDAKVGVTAAMDVWRSLFQSPFFLAAALESTPAIGGHQMIGVGAAILVTSEFAQAEIDYPRPDMNSRLISAIYLGKQVLATPKQVARGNASDGVDVWTLCGVWRDEILTSAERKDLQTAFASSYAAVLSGYRVRRILNESADEPASKFAEQSVVYKTIARFPDLGRTIHLMSQETVGATAASIGNVIFTYREPVLRFRNSDQRLLLTALKGATDQELATELGLTLSAVKARWRSIFARIAEGMPGLSDDVTDNDSRGLQKRHRVLAYLRQHPEELRPYEWQRKPRAFSRRPRT